MGFLIQEQFICFKNLLQDVLSSYAFNISCSVLIFSLMKFQSSSGFLFLWFFFSVSTFWLIFSSPEPKAHKVSL